MWARQLDCCSLPWKLLHSTPLAQATKIPEHTLARPHQTPQLKPVSQRTCVCCAMLGQGSDKGLRPSCRALAKPAQAPAAHRPGIFEHAARGAAACGPCARARMRLGASVSALRRLLRVDEAAQLDLHRAGGLRAALAQQLPDAQVRLHERVVAQPRCAQHSRRYISNFITSKHMMYSLQASPSTTQQALVQAIYQSHQDSQTGVLHAGFAQQRAQSRASLLRLSSPPLPLQRVSARGSLRGCYAAPREQAAAGGPGRAAAPAVA